MRFKKVLFLLSAFGVYAESCFGQTYVGINFDNLAAPASCILSAATSLIGGFAIPPLKQPGATISGGQVLSYSNPYQTSNNVYYTLNTCAGVRPVMTITFDEPASNVNMVIGQIWTSSESVEAQDDCGDNQTIQLLSSDVGGQSLFFPCSSIHQITLTLPSGVWTSGSPAGFYIDSLDFYLNQGLNFVDPVPELMTGTGVVNDSESLATSGTLVKAVAADGVARVLLTAQTAHVGDIVTFSVLNDQGVASSSTQQDGGVTSVAGSTAAAQQSVRAVAQDSSQGPMAFALYDPPADFARGTEDNQSASRVVGIEASITSASATAASTASTISATTYKRALTILRPPVILVHDLWEEPADWNNFPLLNDARFFVRQAAYDGVLGSGITASIPAFPNATLAHARESALGLSYNSPLLLTEISQFIDEFRMVENAAAAQADIVVHGMGGDITRASLQLANYNAPESYGQGNVDKLITIGTPHLGTPFATALLGNQNSCFADILAAAGRFPFSSATVNGASVSGGIGDLEGNGFGGGLSPALAKIQQNEGDTAPTSLIAATVGLSNILTLDSPAGMARFIRLACNGSPLASDLTSLGWFGLFDDLNDAFASVTSQLAGLSGNELSGLVHSTVMEELGFNPPAELDAQSAANGAVTSLLNTSVRSNSFHALP